MLGRDVGNRPFGDRTSKGNLGPWVCWLERGVGEEISKGGKQPRRAGRQRREECRREEWVGEFFGVGAEVRVPRNQPSMAP